MTAQLHHVDSGRGPGGEWGGGDWNLESVLPAQPLGAAVEPRRRMSGPGIAALLFVVLIIGGIVLFALGVGDAGAAGGCGGG